jgi:hypothetical protein
MLTYNNIINEIFFLQIRIKTSIKYLKSLSDSRIILLNVLNYKENRRHGCYIFVVGLNEITFTRALLNCTTFLKVPITTEVHCSQNSR